MNELYLQVSLTYGIKNELFKPALMLSIVFDFVSALHKAEKDLKFVKNQIAEQPTLVGSDFPNIPFKRQGSQRGMFQKIIENLTPVG